MKRIITEYTYTSPRIPQALTIAFVSDLHDGPYADLLPTLAASDLILIGGDLVNRHTGGYTQAKAFLTEVCALPQPIVYAIGNHERKFAHREDWYAFVRQTRATFLDNAVTTVCGIDIGSLSSFHPKRAPDLSGVDALEKSCRYRLLLCHHPEYYPRYVQGRDIDLTLSGHAHGGQICLFGHGILAPGQGLFPKYTHGTYDNGKLVVSRGLTNSAGVPRIGVPLEMIVIHLKPER